MRLALFTDTLFDINGVSRFILNIAHQARLAFGDDGPDQLHILTSTRFPPPPGMHAEGPTIHNLSPRLAMPMPRYPQLELVWPRAGRLRALADSLRPDAVHVSTPGPVGLVGRRYALRRGLPLLGTYHTDFPAYVDHLFNRRLCTRLCSAAMRRFYRPFDRIFTRSADYAKSLESLGIAPDRISRLLPGIDTDAFHTRHGPPTTEARREFWSRYPGVDPDAIKVLSVGRVSVEKNLPFLAEVWGRIGAGAPAQLLVVGDGPYRGRMQAALPGGSAVFLGFRHGEELSALYGAADVFVFPSTTDTLGQVVMEAQSSGLPVIVSDRGGPREVVCADSRNGQTGFVLPADDAAAWVAAIRRLVDDADLRARLGAAGHRAMQRMSIRASFDDFWAVHRGEVER